MSTRPLTTVRRNTSPRRCTQRSKPSATAWATLDLPDAMAPVISRIGLELFSSEAEPQQTEDHQRKRIGLRHAGRRPECLPLIGVEAFAVPCRGL